MPLKLIWYRTRSEFLQLLINYIHLCKQTEIHWHSSHFWIIINLKKMIMKAIIFTVISLFGLALSGQRTLDIELNEDGEFRNTVVINNSNTSNASAVSFTLSSGASSNPSEGRLTNWSNGYNLVPGFSGFTGINGLTSGVLLRAPSNTGQVKFLTGLGEQTRMLIDSNGEIGIGTANPEEKLHLSDGNLYIATAGQTIIFKVASNVCRSLNINAANGNLSAPIVPCPN